MGWSGVPGRIEDLQALERRLRRLFHLSAEAVTALQGWATLPAMVVAGRTPQDLIQSYWEKLAREMGFDIETVEDIDPVANTFTAVAV